MKLFTNRHFCFFVPMALMLGSCASAPPQQANDTHERHHHASRCMSYDGKHLNGGAVSREEFNCLEGNEFAHHKDMVIDSVMEDEAAAFERADRDHDGALSAQELGRMKVVAARDEKVDFVCVANETKQDLAFSLLPLAGSEANEAIDFTVHAGSVFCDPSAETRELYRLELLSRTPQDHCDSASMVDGESLLVEAGPHQERNCKILSAKGTKSFQRDVRVKNGTKGKLAVRAVKGSCRCATFRPGAVTVKAGAERRLRFFVDNGGKCRNTSSECALEVRAGSGPAQRLHCVGLQAEAACTLAEESASRLQLENGPAISVFVP